MMYKYSIIVPAYNEAENIKNMVKETRETMDKLGEPYEIIFIDDRSGDGTYGILKSCPGVKIIKFRTNFGQTAAWDAGFKNAQGEILIFLDADLQNPPSEIPKLLDKIKEGYDVVSGWRYKRQDSAMKKFTSRGANMLRGIFVKDGIHDSGCSLKAYKRECFSGLNLHGEMHRFIVAIMRWQGFKIAEVKVEHRPRIKGKTKYNWRRTIKSFADMIGLWFWRKYSARPLHVFGTIGVILFVIGFLLLIFLFILRLLGMISLSNSIWPLGGVLLVIMGIQLFITGIISDILVKTYYNGKHTYYSIEKIETIGNKENLSEINNH